MISIITDEEHALNCLSSHFFCLRLQPYKITSDANIWLFEFGCEHKMQVAVLVSGKKGQMLRLPGVSNRHENVYTVLLTSSAFPLNLNKGDMIKDHLLSNI